MRTVALDANKDQLSDVDKQYLNKVRKRLFNARKSIESARSERAADNVADSDSDALLTASLPDNLDEIEDILFDRGPLNDNQVKLFGGWLDEAVAGRKATDASVAATETERPSQLLPPDVVDVPAKEEQALQRANDSFAQGMSFFNKGQYRDAVAQYADAVSCVGPESRLGGQYQLWHAQALDAAGDKGAASRMLEALRTHADGDVRKVSRELLFIITAPSLDMAPGYFFDIPSLDDQHNTAPILTSNFGPLRTALLRKKPDPYTIEWYLEKERQPRMPDNSRMELTMVATAIGFTFAYMWLTSTL